MHDAPSTLPSSPTRPRNISHSTAIVLGAGGAAGWSFHIGAADALAEAGLPIEGAPRVIGTSAGAAVSACLLAGTTRDALLDHLMIPPPPEERARAREAIRERRRFPPRLLKPTSASLLRYVLPGRWSPGRAATALVPRGILPTRPLGLFPGLRGSAWPDELWIPAIRLPGGERIVFGRDHSATLADAVEASQSVPMMFAPQAHRRPRSHRRGDRVLDPRRPPRRRRNRPGDHRGAHDPSRSRHLARDRPPRARR